MKKLQTAFLLLFVSITFSACSSDNLSSSSNTNSADYSKAPAPQTQSSNTGGDGGGSGTEKPKTAQQVSLEQADKTQNAPTVTERKIIRNADLSLEADSPDEAQQKITTIAESKGGFVIESQKQSSDAKAAKTDTITMTVRVPAAKFNESLDEIRKLGSRVIYETVKGQDVTEEFIDIEARLKTKKALEEQFLQIMKQGKTVEDALNVQRQLGDVRGEIEQIEGRRRFLENQSSFSTLKIRLQTPAAFSTSSSGFFYQLGEAVGRGFDVALNFILALVTLLIALLPFLIFIVLPIYLLIRYFFKKSRKQKLASDIARDEIKNE